MVSLTDLGVVIEHDVIDDVINHPPEELKSRVSASSSSSRVMRNNNTKRKPAVFDDTDSTRSESYNTKRERRRNTWHSCCWDVDRRCLFFSAKITFSFIIMLFCCIMIYRDSDACSNSLLSWYCSIVGLILGVFTNVNKEEEVTRNKK